MKRNILLLLIFMCCWLVNASLYAQENSSSTLDLLQTRNWTMWFPSKENFTMTARFDSNNIWHVFFSHKGEELDLEQTYCISNSPSFENIELIKRQRLATGRYLISKNQTETVAYEIVKLTADSLILKRLDSFSIITFLSFSKKWFFLYFQYFSNA